MIGIPFVRPVSVLKPNSQSNLLTANNSNDSFEKVLGKALDGVNQLKVQANELNSKLAAGQLEYIHQAPIMAEKASLALELTLQIRNKVVEAYQEIMRTQV